MSKSRWRHDVEQQIAATHGIPVDDVMMRRTVRELRKLANRLRALAGSADAAADDLRVRVEAAARK